MTDAQTRKIHTLAVALITGGEVHLSACTLRSSFDGGCVLHLEERSHDGALRVISGSDEVRRRIHCAMLELLVGK